MYKHRSNDTMYVGPCWDFDLAFDNDQRTYPVNNKTDYIYRSGGSCAGYMQSLVDKIVVYDAGAKQQLAALWANIRQSGFTEESMLDYIDEQAQLLNESQRLNFIRWKILSQRVHQNPSARGSYQAEVDVVRTYMRNRIPWMDNKLGFDTTALDIEAVKEQPKAEKILINGQ